MENTVFTTSQLSHAIGVSVPSIIDRAKKVLNKTFEHGKPAYFTREEILKVLEAITRNPSNNLTEEQRANINNLKVQLKSNFKVELKSNLSDFKVELKSSAKVATTYANSAKVAPKPDKFEQELRNAVDTYLITYNARKLALQNAKEAFEQTKQEGEQLMNALYAKTNILDWEQHVSNELAKIGN